jgi:FMN phosphatase YigB (HAD superfamily)
VITTLLFDLDGTLLGNDLNVFLPAYFGGLGDYLPPGADPQRVQAEMINATRAMIGNSDPARVLFDVFRDCFSFGTGWPEAEWRPVFDRYYAGAYRGLERLTQRLPAARAVMEWAFSQNFTVVIATNPLFPEPAVRERLRWAGLADFPYALITTIESSHFAKPNPAYYAETLARVGRRPEQALMIGNDWENDMAAAAAAGLRGYLVTEPGATGPVNPDWAAGAPGRLALEAQPVGRGTLEEFLAWARTELADLPPPAPDGRALPYLLTGNLAVVAAELTGLPEAAWTRRPKSGEWSLTELICHLRDVEREVNLPRLRSVVETDNPFVAGADTDPWATERDYQAQSGPEALRDFIAARREAARYLRTQPDSIWTRTARHAIFGPTQLIEIVGWILDHDRIHLDQVRGTVARVTA